MPIDLADVLSNRVRKMSLPMREESDLLAQEQAHLDRTRSILEAPTEPVPAPEPGILSKVGGAVTDAFTAVGQLQAKNAPIEQAAQTGAGEALLALGTGAVGGLIGAGTALEKAATDALTQGGPSLNQIKGLASGIGDGSEPHYWENLVKEAQKVGSEFTYAPRTEVGQLATRVLSTPFEALHYMSQGASEAPLARMIFTPDQRKAVAYAHELVTMMAVGELVGVAGSSMRGTVSRFKSEFSKAAKEGGTSEGLLSSAEEVIKKAESVPEWSDRVARLKELQKEDATAPLDEWLSREGAPTQGTGDPVQEMIKNPIKEVQKTIAGNEAPVLNAEVVPSAPRVPETPIISIEPSQTPALIEPPLQALRSYRSERYSKVSPAERANYELGIVDAGVELEKAATKPSTLSTEQKLSYAQERANSFSSRPELQKSIQDAIEQGNKDFGLELARELPGAVRGDFAKLKFDEAFAEAQKGIKGSEPRNIQDIITDIANLFTFDVDPSSTGILGGNISLSYSQKMAAQRLSADAMKAGRTLEDHLRELKLPELVVRSYTDYLASTKIAPPPASNIPRNMPLDIGAMPGGSDPVVKQRVRDNGMPAAPLRESEVSAVQEAPVKGENQSIAGVEIPLYRAEHFGESIKEITIYPARDAVNSAHAESKLMKQDLKELSNGVTYPEKRNISSFVQDQANPNPQGLTLNPKEAQVLKILAEGVTNLIDRVQKIRQAMGLEPLRPIENPILFMRSMLVARKLKEGVNLTSASSEHVAIVYEANKTAQFPKTLTQKTFRMGNAMDIFHQFDEFSTATTESLKFAPVVAKLKELSGTTLPDLSTRGSGQIQPVLPGMDQYATPTYVENWKMAEKNPGLYDFITRYYKNIEGIPELSIGKVHGIDVDGILRTLTENMTWGLLSFSFKSAAAQPASLRHTWYMTGTKNTFGAIGESLASVFGRGTWYQELLDNSKVVTARDSLAMFADWTEPFSRGSLKEIVQSVREGRVRDTIAGSAKIGMYPLQALDYEMAVITGNAFRKYGESLGLKGKDLWNFVDDGIIKTQGSGWRIDRPPLQRSVAGRAAAQFGTFTIAEYNLLINEVLKPKPGESNLSVVKNVARLAAITTAYNILMEDVLQMNSPAPTPIRDAIRRSEQGGSPLSIASAFAFGLIGPYTPPPFGGTRFGKSPGGPVANKLVDLASAVQGRPGSVNPLEPLSELAGVPVSGFAWSTLRPNDTRGLWDTMVNNPRAPSSGGGGPLKGGLKGGLKRKLK